MKTYPIANFQKIPHIDATTLSGRFVASLSFLADGQWTQWIPTEDGLISMKAWPAESCYFAKERERESDCFFQFLDFIAQRGNLTSVQKAFRGLIEDFFNLAASLQKFDILFENYEKHRLGLSRLVATELEYLVSLCRSIFDLLQEVIAAQWHSVALLDKSNKKKQLPKSFSEMVLKGQDLRSQEDIEQRFLIPADLAFFYHGAGPFFQLLRTLRDKFIHGGNSPESIFVTSQGFAMKGDVEPFSKLMVWNQEHRLPNDLCSLRPVLAYFVNETLRACEAYSVAIQNVVQFFPPTCPGMKFFMRGFFSNQLLQSESILSECKWWN
jgi:hypothetical protein